MDREKYQGWTNHATWIVYLHLTTDEGLYYYWRAEAESAKVEANKEPHEYWTPEEHARFRLSETMREELMDACFDLLDDGGELPEPLLLVTDLVDSALEDVNWMEIAKAFLEE